MSLETEVFNLKTIISTPVLGIAMPVLKSGQQELRYDCSLCEMKGMEKNYIYCHLQEIHKVLKRKFDQLPVIGEVAENRMIVTTAGPLDTNQQISRKESKKKETKRDPNLRELPVSVKSLVEDKSEEYVVKGDGPCLLRTAAAHIEGNEDNGPIMGRNLNTHLSEYRPYYKDKIGDFPIEVTIGVNGESKVFEPFESYFDWLQESKKAAYMWRNGVDMIALSNMTHMDIDVVVYEKGSKPELFVFKPDPEFPWEEDDKMKPIDGNVKQGKMTVLNWKNVHYNLIVGPNHMLSQAGSLKFQASNQPFTEVREEVILEGGDSESREQESGTENRDMDNDKETEEQKKSQSSSEWSIQGGNICECPICGLTRNNKHQMTKHMKSHNDETDDSSFTCKYCSYQSMNRDQLVEHLERKHVKYICNKCNKSCDSKHELGQHIQEDHISHKPCRYFATASCEYDDECRFEHVILRKDQHICYTCGVIKTSVKDLMVHIKEIHGSQPCTKYAEGKCDRNSRCWYSHNNLPTVQPPYISENQGFQETPTMRHYSTMVGAQHQMHKLWTSAQNQNLKQATHRILTEAMPNLINQILKSLIS